MTATGSDATRPTRPGRLAVWTVTAAAYVLPRGYVRARYRREFVAELYGMTPRRQLAHASSIVVAVLPLRAAIRHDSRFRTEDLMTTPARPLLCALNLHHVWHQEHTDDGGRYQRCLRCGKDRGYAGGSAGSGDWAAAFGGGHSRRS
jgi:hypothetical protein